MQIIVRYAKRGRDDRERIRQVVLRVKGPDLFGIVMAAQEEKQPGERIIAIIEAGYH